MTQDRKQINKIAELNSTFLSLNEAGQEGALNILRSLKFAQEVMKDVKQTQQAKPA